jgi:uncharacterized protein (DUF1015 family)
MALLTLSDPTAYLAAAKEHTESDVVKLLDVSILQNLILEKTLGITREQVAAKVDVTFNIHAVEVMRKVDEGEATIGLILSPINMAKVIEVATGGEVMPQKSTYFYPKLISGLVMNPLG